MIDCPCMISALCEKHGISARVENVIAIAERIDEREAGEIDAHIAMSLYQYNVGPGERAQKILHHFDSDCAPMHTLMEWADSKNWATEMPLPTAKIYLEHALERYSAEATDRRKINERAGS